MTNQSEVYMEMTGRVDWRGRLDLSPIRSLMAETVVVLHQRMLLYPISVLVAVEFPGSVCGITFTSQSRLVIKDDNRFLNTHSEGDVNATYSIEGENQFSFIATQRATYAFNEHEARVIDKLLELGDCVQDIREEAKVLTEAVHRQGRCRLEPSVEYFVNGEPDLTARVGSTEETTSY